MTITINGTDGITTPEVTLDNTSADGGQVVLKSSGYSNWNLDNYSGRIRAYYGSTEYFTINSSGNVGIGTSSPTQKLTVVTAARVVRSGDETQWGDFGQDSSGGYVQWQRPSSSLYENFRFIASNTSGSVERARIDSSGRMSINNTGFGAMLNIFVNTSIASEAAITKPDANSSYNAMVFKNSSGGNNGYIQVTTSNTTSYVTTSDYRLKEDVQPMVGALDKVSQLKPCTYKWKDGSGSSQGFIAHELQAIVPEAVCGQKDAVDAKGNPDYQGIDTSFLVATLTAAIQEQQVIIESLKTRIETLENK